MRTTVPILLLARTLVVAATSPAIFGHENILILRSEDYCGQDLFESDTYCEGDDSVCCSGTLQSVCMPANHTCCDTGFYREPGSDCPPDGPGTSPTPVDVCSALAPTSTRVADSEPTDDPSNDGEEEEGEGDSSASYVGISKALLAAMTGLVLLVVA